MVSGLEGDDTISELIWRRVGVGFMVELAIGVIPGNSTDAVRFSDAESCVVHPARIIEQMEMSPSNRQIIFIFPLIPRSIP